MPRSLFYSTVIVSLLAIVAACGGPTSPSSPDRSSVAGDATNAHRNTASRIGASDDGRVLGSALEQFNCTDVSEVRVRFSHPGYIKGNRVGLHALYSGVPDGDKLLRVWWNLDDDPSTFQDFRLGQGDAHPGSDELFDLWVLAEHTYPPPSRPESRMVRAELIILGATGNCARNRTIIITPPVPDIEAAAAADPCDNARFCDLGDGTVRDNTTGLVWLRQANCLPIRRFVGAVADTAALSDGQCGLNDGSLAGSWRLPTALELQSLLDARFTDPQLSNAAGDGQWTEGDAFLGVRNQAHWTSDLQDPCLATLPGAMVVRVGNGATRCLITSIGLARVWPVRD